MFKLICMSFDGGYRMEWPEFKTVEKAWQYSNDMGSRWYFYPFHFVVTASGKTIADAPEMFAHLKGKRVTTVAAIFNSASKLPELQNADVDQFAYSGHI